MSTLQDFLNSNPVDNVTDDVAISDRFRDADGNLLKFTIRAMKGNTFEDIRKKSMNIRKNGKVEMDAQKFNETVVIDHTVVPDFKDAASIQKLGCITPSDYLNRVLLPGEVAELAEQIQRLSGFGRSMEDLVEDAKN
ncbi:XkdN-like protein [Paenibacillus hemerocallicola]|jgi:hypothetical protein|uniref:XkdN-like protein n=1 Tax=Paenibacillus hemerocallicola TaxID=1172614 RepID=A0A5C4TGX4_9BACL|nr:XkdN-like protein [Paenibacillus hemerocallicola]TNJ68228.1 XkdN-like protein [Paenibacillus hemerocallicola]